MQADIAIVVAAYNRPASLKRLLDSISQSDFTGFADISLIISIDYSGENDCEQIAKKMEWKHGKKSLILHNQNIGLKRHILFCGDLAANYEAIVLLEDDLLVSPAFYDYAQQAHLFYKEAENVAGIGLYSCSFNETAFCPFEPVHDGYDNYFMQVPCSWGQLWSSKNWLEFKKYLDEIDYSVKVSDLPPNVKLWPDDSSWKKLQYKYLIETGKYYVYPRQGLTTNFSEVGKHINEEVLVFQCSLLNRRQIFTFSYTEDSLSIYDFFYELHGDVFNRMTGKKLSISFDLNGAKSLDKIDTEWLFSCKECLSPESRFGTALYPYENNIFFQLKAPAKDPVFISFGKTNTFTDKKIFHRFTTDIKRNFADINYIIQHGRREVEKTAAFILGKKLLRPYYYFKKLFINIRSNGK